MAEMTAEERAREWSGLEPVQQVFMDGYFKNATFAATAIFQAGEVMQALINQIRQAEQAAVEREREAACDRATKMFNRMVNPNACHAVLLMEVHQSYLDAIRARGTEKREDTSQYYLEDPGTVG